MSDHQPVVASLVAALSAPDRPLPPVGDRALSAGELTTLLAAARVAPSADNAQIWRFVTVQEPATKAQLAPAVPPALRESLPRAGALIVTVGTKWLVTGVRREQPFALVDVPIALTHLLLMATELGLATAWTLEVDEPLARAALGIPETARVVGLVLLGWPA